MKKYLFLIIVVICFQFLPSLKVEAVSGTCSSHGGVDCSAGADWDGSAICYDGWRDSSEIYSQQLICKNTHHLCTQSESDQLDIKYGVNDLYQQIQAVDAQAKALEQQLPSKTDPEYTSKITEITGLYYKEVALQQNWQLAFNQSQQECYALGDAEYAQKLKQALDEIYNQTQSQPQTQSNVSTPVDICVQRGILNSHLVNQKYCQCNTGFYYSSKRNSCVVIQTYCSDTLGDLGVVSGSNNCVCKQGYIYDRSSMQCLKVEETKTEPQPVNEERPITKVAELPPVQHEIIKPDESMASSSEEQIQVEPEVQNTTTEKNTDSTNANNSKGIMQKVKSIFNSVGNFFKKIGGWFRR